MAQLIAFFTLLLASPLLSAPQNPFWLNADSDTEIEPVIPPQITQSRPRPPPPANNEPPSPPAPQTFHSAPADCSCSFTRQFNPICGSDGNTYANIAILNCFVECGVSQATVRYQGACRRNG